MSNETSLRDLKFMGFLKHFSIYAFVGIAGAAVNFFLMPYLSHFIAPAEYGMLAMINTLVTILIPFIGLVASSIITIEYYKIIDKSEFASFFSSIQLIPIMPTIIFLLSALIFSKPLANFFELPHEKSYWIPLSVVIASLVVYYETLLSYNIIQKKSGHFAVFNFVKLFIEVSLTIILVSKFKLSWEGRLLSWLVTSVIMFVIAIFYFEQHALFTKRISWKYINMGICFGLPLILHTVGKFVINQSDRVFIAKMISIDQAGIYNIGYQVGMMMLLVVNAVSNFYYPFLYENLEANTNEKKLQIVKTSYFIIGIMIVFLLAMTILSPLFFKWFVNKDYVAGNTYVFWVGLGYIFWGIYMLFAGFIYYMKKTKFLGWMAMFNVSTNLLFNYFLIKKFGAIGAAYATCLSFFVVALMVFIEVNKSYKLPWLDFNLIMDRKV